LGTFRFRIVSILGVSRPDLKITIWEQFGNISVRNPSHFTAFKQGLGSSKFIIWDPTFPARADRRSSVL